MTAWASVIIGGVASYFIRASFIAFTGQRSLPQNVERALRYVGPAVFGAIVLPAVLGSDGFAAALSPDARLLAAVLAGFITWKLRNIPVGLVVGMGSLWFLQWAGL